MLHLPFLMSPFKIWTYNDIEPDGENILKILITLCNISCITFTAFFFSIQKSGIPGVKMKHFVEIMDEKRGDE